MNVPATTCESHLQHHDHFQVFYRVRCTAHFIAEVVLICFMQTVEIPKLNKVLMGLGVPRSLALRSSYVAANITRFSTGSSSVLYMFYSFSVHCIAHELHKLVVWGGPATRRRRMQSTKNDRGNEYAAFILVVNIQDCRACMFHHAW